MMIIFIIIIITFFFLNPGQAGMQHQCLSLLAPPMLVTLL
jgi:hypothetical protein